MVVVYRPVVRWTGCRNAAGLPDPVDDANIIVLRQLFRVDANSDSVFLHTVVPVSQGIP